MSVAELKEQIVGLSPEERTEIAVFLARMEGDEEAEYHALLSQRMKAMDAGKKVTAEEFEARHKELSAKGL